MSERYVVVNILDGGDLDCATASGGRKIIDPYVDHSADDSEEYTWKVGDVFECEVFPYIPSYIARYKTIRKLSEVRDE